MVNSQDILATLRHYGGSTNLIDFTSDYRIALFFACDGALEKEGRIILFDTENEKPKIKTQVHKRRTHNRVIAQKSVFIESETGYLKSDEVRIISIMSSLKPDILGYLKKYHAISTETVYNDIFGYIQHQEKYHTPYTEYYLGLSAQDRKYIDKAIKHYTEAIKLKPDFAEAYYNRGNAHRSNGTYEEATKDFTKAIALKPDLVVAHNEHTTGTL